MTKPTKFSNLSNVFLRLPEIRPPGQKFRQTSFHEIDFSGASRQEKKKCYRLCYLCYRLRQPWMPDGSEFDSTWYVWTSWTFSRTRAVFSRVWNAPWLAHILMKTAWNLKLGIFSTQKGLKLAHQEHFKHTAHSCRNFRKVHTLLIGIHPRFTGTAQANPPGKFP